LTNEVKQLRSANDRIVKDNPSRVFYFVDGVLKSEVVRLPHEATSAPENAKTPTGRGTSFSLFCQMRYDSQIKEGVVLVDGSRGWRVGPVDSLKHNGIVYSLRAPLQSVIPSKDCSIVSFKIGAAVGTINQLLGTISVTVPSGTDLTALTPTIDHRGKSISRTGAQNFSSPVHYTVTAENLTTKTYTVTVGVAS